MNASQNAVPRLARLLAAGIVIAFVVVACAGQAASIDPTPEPPEPSPLGSDAPSPSPSLRAPETDDELALCRSVTAVAERMDGLQAVPLRFENRVALDIELGKVQSAFSELRRADLGDLDDQLDDPLRRLGYRLIDLEIAVEDFRTSARVRRAGNHVEDDASAMDDAVAGFAILARC